MASAAGFTPGDRERRLSFVNLVSREVERKPFRAVDLGKAACRVASISRAIANAVGWVINEFEKSLRESILQKPTITLQ
jgi:hypothetical protein